MANNWAIVIGINEYRFLQTLKYAKRDAEAMQNFLAQEAKFDRIFLFTDDSPPINGKPTDPIRNNLLRVLRQIFAQPFMKDGDNFWFFFSGHGIRHNEQDYLMPLDGDPEDVENTGIPTNTITSYLRSCGADNVVMILDACRSGGKKSGEGIGRQTEKEARQTGVISIFSCSPDQYSYELEAIGQGAFTYSLLEGLSIRGRCATVERLDQYLQSQVPQLVQQHLGRARQIPYTIAEPINRSHLILMPQYASLTDIATLKNDAYRAQIRQDWDLAQRLWIRVLATALGQDIEAIEALQTIALGKATENTSNQPQQGKPQNILPKSSKELDSQRIKLDSLSNIASDPPKSKSVRETIEEIFEDEVGDNKKEASTLREVISTLREPIKKALNKGYSYEEIVTMLADKGINISVLDLKRYLSLSDSVEERKQDDLSSERFGANYYAQLRDLLKAGQWKEADKETADRMCEVMDRQKEDGLRIEDVKKFPCQDLRNIDRLWVHYSNGRFGFSIQKQIWQECGSPTSSGKEWNYFLVKLGWYDDDFNYTSYSSLKFNPAISSLGELPALGTLSFIKRFDLAGFPQHKPGKYSSLVFCLAEACQL